VSEPTGPRARERAEENSTKGVTQRREIVKLNELGGPERNRGPEKTEPTDEDKAGEKGDNNEREIKHQSMQAVAESVNLNGCKGSSIGRGKTAQTPQKKRRQGHITTGITSPLKPKVEGLKKTTSRGENSWGKKGK